MFDDLIKNIKDISLNRLRIVFVLVAALFFICIVKIFQLQVMNNNENASNAQTMLNEEGYHYVTVNTVPVRGNIYDRDGNLLAYNEIQYNIELFNSADLKTNAERNAAIYDFILLLEEYGFEEEFEFPMILDEQGVLQYTVSDSALNRLLKNCYGLASANDLTEEQKNTTPQELFDYLCHGNEITSMFGIDDTYTTEQALEIINYRYQLYINNPSYAPIRIVSDISEEFRIVVMENQSIVPCVEISRTYKRVYNDAEYFAHIIGYVGKITEAELSEHENDEVVCYIADSVVGKLGVEKSYDGYLQGTCGEQRITLNSMGQIVEKEMIKQPVDGLDLYLTVERDSQIAGYYILEKNIAAILMNAIVNSYSYGSMGEDADDITIPIFEVYNALIANNIIDISSFEEGELTEAENAVYSSYLEYESMMYERLQGLITKGNSTKYNDLATDTKEFVDFIYDSCRGDWALINKNIDFDSEHFVNFTNGKSSLADFLWGCVENGNVDTNSLNLDGGYYSSDEIYTALYDVILSNLKEDSDFAKLIYRTLIFDQEISGKNLCLVLFDQEILEQDKDSYDGLKYGTLSSYDFVIRKINNLEITPAMLALKPCSGSLVVTDPNNGDTIAMVSYPSYDNNMLTNQVNYDYYSKIYEDMSYPMLCRATQSKTNTGSTFKPLTAVIGLTEGIITTDSIIYDRIKFDKIVPSPSCWSSGSHGSINVTDAIRDSCNYFFFDVAYSFSKTANGNYSDSQGMELIKKYATMFGFGDVSGVEISESMPEISSSDAVRTAIGYGHSFAPIQIAKYATTITNGGTCYNLTLIDTVKSDDGSVVYEQQPSIYNSLSQVEQESWDAIHLGMKKVVSSGLSATFKNVGVEVAGKTGTAQVSLNQPNNALFISYAPFENPELTVTVVLPNGYKSANAAKVASEYYDFYFNNTNYENLLSGNVFAGEVDDTVVGD